MNISHKNMKQKQKKIILMKMGKSKQNKEILQQIHYQHYKEKIIKNLNIFLIYMEIT